MRTPPYTIRVPKFRPGYAVYERIWRQEEKTPHTLYTMDRCVALVLDRRMAEALKGWCMQHLAKSFDHEFEIHAISPSTQGKRRRGRLAEVPDTNVRTVTAGKTAAMSGRTGTAERAAADDAQLDGSNYLRRRPAAPSEPATI